ncbi:NACHT domain-containing protein [Winogradskyella sp.]|uniref:NACHT domain-containing protein n=1 Tax=Winogradskyella sp. TaxID=1883156 RepID=UPI0026189077|nr:NACHT domain-containing protein [Winogradskyella sp.]
MKNNSSNGNEPEWLKFEKEVAKLFELFGYDQVIHDVKMDAGQCDVLAISNKRDRANIIAECKLKSKSSSKVGIVDVQNFINKVSNYRSEGKIDQGYLITNNGFTSDAKAAINDRVKNFVFLLTYDELIQSLLSIKNYLEDYIYEYDKSRDGDKFVDLKLINTTTLNETILDCTPGDLIKSKKDSCSYLVVDKQSLYHKELELPFIDYSHSKSNPSLNIVDFLKEEKRIEELRLKSQNDYTRKKLECLTNSVKKVAAKKNEEMLPHLFINVKDLFLNENKLSPIEATRLLLNDWEKYGGGSGSKLKRKYKLRSEIQREILADFNTNLKFVSLESPKIHPFLSNYLIYVYDNLNIRRKDFLSASENIIEVFESDTRTIPKLKLLIEEQAFDSLNEFLHSHSSQILVLIGDYGAGKTTIIKKLMRTLAQEKLNNKTDPKHRTPLYITLKDYSKVPDMQSLIKLFLRDNADLDDVSIRTFKKLNEQGRFVLLLDAFDEMLKQVTKADRRRCFKEISNLVNENSKIILTGRPSYFNDYLEFKENLEILINDNDFQDKNPISYEIRCLQLLDEEKVEELIKKVIPSDSSNILDLILDKPNLMDLARRPVLANMIANSGNELVKLESKEISARDIYKIYTNKWVEIEEDKGEFRILNSSKKKHTFLQYLAMQMHISGNWHIHYSDLDESINKYFDLDNNIKLDHFSHDIRTCSFLSRTDDGYYFFIHKSFMEYFIACEFVQLENSPFCESFSNDLTHEIIDLLDFSALPAHFSDLLHIRPHLENCLSDIIALKSKMVKESLYEEARYFRDAEKIIEDTLSKFNSFFTMEKSNHLQEMMKWRQELINIYSSLDTPQRNEFRFVIRKNFEHIDLKYNMKFNFE